MCIYTDTSDKPRSDLLRWLDERIEQLKRALADQPGAAWTKPTRWELGFFEDTHCELADFLRGQAIKTPARMLHEMALSWSARDPEGEDQWREEESLAAAGE